MYLINQLGKLDFLEFWNLEYYVIFVYFFFNNKKFTFSVKSKQQQKKIKYVCNIQDSKIQE